MSLPPAQKDISARPAKGSVTDPLDKAKKDKDVERKLKLYTSIQALRASCLPSNAQIDSLLSYFQRNVENVDKETAISADTKRLLADFNSILEAIKVEVNDKNGDELLQDLIWRTRPSNGPAETLDQSDASAAGKKVVVDKDKAKEDGSQGMAHSFTRSSPSNHGHGSSSSHPNDIQPTPHEFGSSQARHGFIGYRTRSPISWSCQGR